MDERIEITWAWCPNCWDRESHKVLPDGRLECEICGTVSERPASRKDLEVLEEGQKENSR